jgi:hypothetical protein
MAIRQSRGNKLLREEVAFLKTLFNRFRNDREVRDLFFEETGKRVSVGLINFIRNGVRWADVEPSTEKPWQE